MKKTRTSMALLVAAIATVSGCKDDTSGTSAERLAIEQPVPEFSLVSQDSRTFGSKDLQGKAWIATFIFTRCGLTCPKQTAEFVKLQEEFRDHPTRSGVHFVCFTVDPHYDSPQVLQEYGKAIGADFARWTFLTGQRSVIHELCEKGFLLAVGEAGEDAASLVTHSQKFVLVDRGMTIRGYYDGLDAVDVERLKRDLDGL